MRLLDSVAAATKGTWTAARQNPLRTLVTLLVSIPCLRLLSVEARSTLGALYGIHEWRQGWTYSVAYAFVHEDATFFHPKHAWRGNLSGIVGMEPPIYPWVTAQLMRVFGDAPGVGRLLNFTLFVATFALWLRSFWRRTGYESALALFVLAAFCPAVLCEFRQFQPDPTMTCLAILAMLAFQRHGEIGTPKSFALGLGLYTLAMLTKPIAIAILPAMFLFSVMGPLRPSLRGAALRMVAFALPIVLYVAWDKWCIHLVNKYMNGSTVISIEHDPAAMWNQFKNVANQRYILLGLLQSYTCHVSLFPAVLLGVPYGLRKETRGLGVPLLVWFAGVAVVSLAYSDRYYSNWYYMLLFVPPLSFFGAMGLGSVFEVITLQRSEPLRLLMAIAIVVAACLTVPLLRELPWDHIEHIADQLAVHVRREVSSGTLYWVIIALSCMSAACLLALGLLDLTPRIVLALLLAAGAGWAMRTPFRDTLQTVRFYTTEPDWEAGHVDSAEIRAAVNRYSTPQELFLMNGANPALLARALRNGYADDGWFIDVRGLQYHIDNHVRFFMNFADSPPMPQSMAGAQLLEKGARWALYCIDPKGCPRLDQVARPSPPAP